MVLNINCVRDVLLYLEQHLSMTPELEIIPISVFELEASGIFDYSIQELANTITALYEAGFLVVKSDYGYDRIVMLDVYRITFAGYQFIETIRPKPVWDKVMHVGKNVGSFSFDFVSKVAAEVFPSLITFYLSRDP